VRLTFEPDDIDILQGIVEESSEHLRGIEEGILRLEADFDPETVDSVFRALHSVKGVAGLLDLTPIKDCAHCLESMLTDIRKGLYIPDSEITDLLLRGVDVLHLQLAEVVAQLQELQADPPQEPFALNIPDAGGKELAATVEEIRLRLTGQSQPEPDEEARPEQSPDFSYLLDQMLPDFIDETVEHLSSVEHYCVELEKHPQDPQILNSIMRSFHSIKGGAGVIASMRPDQGENDPVKLIRALTHAAETVLQSYLGQNQPLSESIVDLVLQAVDKVSALVKTLGEGGEPDPSTRDIIQRMEMAARCVSSRRNETEESMSTRPFLASNQLAAFINIANQALESIKGLLDTAREGYPVRTNRFRQYSRALKNLHSSARYLGFNELAEEAATQAQFVRTVTPERDVLTGSMLERLRAGFERLLYLLETKVAEVERIIEEVPLEYADKRLGEILVESGLASPSEVAMALSKQAVAREKQRETAEETRPVGEIAGQSVRVSQEKLDRLMNMIGELLISKNNILHLARKVSMEYNLPALSREVKAAAMEVARISDELQDAIMSARMIPLRVLFQRYPRTIRDISRKSGKQVDLVITGEDTELDKTVIEAINDPLVHMLRNAVDHGIEPPEERKALGKHPQGTISLRAYYQGGYVVIEISDDGRGLDPERIKQKAVEKGLVHPVHAQTMSPEDLYQFIFAPGFSTAQEVTELSGRGVGMDVVKNNIERLGGFIYVDSQPSAGITFTLKIPLSMSIIQGLMVEALGQRFIIALDAIVETVKLPLAFIRSYKQKLVADIRGQIIPLIRLGQVLGIESPSDRNGVDQSEDGRVPIVVLDIDRVRVGLIVDRFQNQQEFVIKSLSEELAGLKVYSGATILGDGSVVLILNPVQLLQLHLTGS